MASSSTLLPLERLIDDLLVLLRQTSTLEVNGYLSAMWMLQGPEVVDKWNLSSPLRQTFYLLGLLMTTPEPDQPEALSEERWRRIVSLLNRIVEAYMRNATEAMSLGNVDPEKAGVATFAFLQRFMSGRLAVAEQMVTLVRELCAPFDERLRAAVGISATATLEMVDWMKSTLIEQWEATFEKMGAAKDLTARALDMVASGEYPNFDSSEWRASPEFQAAQSMAAAMYDATLRPNALEIALFVERFGQESTDAFLRLFALRRGTVEGFRYFASPNPPNPAELAPLVILDERFVCAPLHAMLYNSVYERFDDVLREIGDVKERYLKRRSVYLETRANSLVASLFPKASVVLNGYFETDDAQNEHDGLILTDRSLIVLEEKSAEMRTPSRDIERCFRNLTDQFRSKTGIQHAYDQATRVIDLVEQATEPVPFYDEAGSVIARIDGSAVDETYAICVTLESFGVLAIDLTLLLKVPAGKRYPWVVNLFDLETLVDAFHRKALTGADFLRYLRRRRELQGRVSSDDELNIGGQFIVEGDLVDPGAGRHGMVMGYADMFDDLYLEQHGVKSNLMAGAVPGGVHMDLNASLAAGEPVFVQSRASAATPCVTKVGRNKQCPCGSHKKYKNCCGAA